MKFFKTREEKEIKTFIKFFKNEIKLAKENGYNFVNSTRIKTAEQLKQIRYYFIVKGFRVYGEELEPNKYGIRIEWED